MLHRARRHLHLHEHLPDLSLMERVTASIYSETPLMMVRVKVALGGGRSAGATAGLKACGPICVEVVVFWVVGNSGQT